MIFCGLKFDNPGRSPAGIGAAQLAPGSGLTYTRHPRWVLHLWYPLGGRMLVCTLHGEKGVTDPYRKPKGQGRGQLLHSVLATQDCPSSA